MNIINIIYVHCVSFQVFQVFLACADSRRAATAVSSTSRMENINQPDLLMSPDTGKYWVISIDIYRYS